MEYLHYNEDTVLERVDEYSLYCYYMGFDPLIGKKYSSPLRKGDDDPSFAIFERKDYRYGYIPCDYLWKDQALNLRGPKDIFSFVQIRFNYDTRLEALWKICKDFGLGGAIPDDKSVKLITKVPKFSIPVNITVRSRSFNARDLSFWRVLNVRQELLNHYNTTAIACYWINEEQEHPYFPKDNTGYAYRVETKYQLYFPTHEKRKKFRTGWNEYCIPGLAQLSRNDLLVVTKSYKDILCLRSFGYDAVAPHGENIMLPSKFIEYASKRYKKVVTLFDNDGKHKAREYPWEELHIPLVTKQKDPTDYCKAYGVDATRKLLKELLHG